MFGIARHVDGSPWKNATVRLVALPAGTYDDTADVVTALTDERGEFRAAVVPALEYEVRALEELGDEVRLSAPQWTRASPVLLEASIRVPRLRVEFEGLEAWRDGAGDMCFWVGPGFRRSNCVPFELQESGPTAVPTLADGVHLISVTSENGSCFFAARIEPQSDGAPITVAVPPPRLARVRVIDEQLQPVVGARLDATLIDRAFSVATTDDDGIAEFVLPHDPGCWEIRWALEACLRISKPGYESGYLQPNGGFFASSEDPQQHQLVVLARSHRPRGRLLWDADTPLGEVPLIVRGRSRLLALRDGEPTRLGGPVRIERVSTDAEGAFVLDVGIKTALIVEARLDDERRAALARRLGTSVSPLAWAWAGALQPQDGALGDVRIDRLRPVRITVRHADRRPAPSARITLGIASHPDVDEPPVERLTADQNGSVTVLLPPSCDLALGAEHDNAGDVVEFAVPPAEPGEGPAALTDFEIVLPEPFVIEGEITAGGRPVEGVRLFPEIPLSGKMPDPPPPAPESATRPGGAPVILRRGRFDPNVDHAVQIYFALAATETNAAGHYRLAVPFGNWAVTVRATRTVDGQAERRRETLNPPLAATTTLDWKW